MIDDEMGTAERRRMPRSVRIAYWTPRVCLVLGIIGVVIWWWLES